MKTIIIGLGTVQRFGSIWFFSVFSLLIPLIIMVIFSPAENSPRFFSRFYRLCSTQHSVFIWLLIRLCVVCKIPFHSCSVFLFCFFFRMRKEMKMKKKLWNKTNLRFQCCAQCTLHTRWSEDWLIFENYFVCCVLHAMLCCSNRIEKKTECVTHSWKRN